MTENTNSLKTEPDIHLNAEVGTEMQVEVVGLDARVKLKLMGLINKRYLIFHVPKKLHESTGKIIFTEGVGVNIRCISRGYVFGFHSNVISINKTPVIAIYIEYPKKIQTQTIRKSNRVKCLLPAKAMNDGVEIKGSVADISRSGCHFQYRKKSLSVEQIKLSQPNQKIEFAFSLPGMEAEKKINAIIKNTFIDQDKAQVGIEFLDVEPKTLELLDDFIAMSFDISPL